MILMRTVSISRVSVPANGNDMGKTAFLSRRSVVPSSSLQRA
jgi:hypothetical protein